MINYTISGDQRLQITSTCETICDGIELIHITMHSDLPVAPQQAKISWSVDVVDIQDIWHPTANYERKLQPSWGGFTECCSTVSAPVICLIGGGEFNRFTFAVSDALNVIRLSAGVNEHTAQLDCAVSFFDMPTAPLTDYSVTLRFDTRNIAYNKAIGDVALWWESEYVPSPVPEYAKLPMYSTWYSFHQELTPESVEQQCRLAKELGCESVIVDDGWQTADNSQGYGYCGDWEVCTDKIPDMAAHVKRVHDMGMKYILWYSVPFVGYYSKAYDKFKSMSLYDTKWFHAMVLDPRYTAVRDYLIGKYKTAVDEWGLDGFKLDFVDQFTQQSADKETADIGRDCQSVPQAVDVLLSDVMAQLREQNPDVMIEFRQRYIGPLMRKYGNMLRATDCPNDPHQNRIHTIDIRLLCGSTAAHSDMLMWHSDEPVEVAATHIINILFSVPQISVMLDKIPQSHRDMIKFYLGLWRKYRDLLLFG